VRAVGQAATCFVPRRIATQKPTARAAYLGGRKANIDIGSQCPALDGLQVVVNPERPVSLHKGAIRAIQSKSAEARRFDLV
jgi:hypothetical protein